MERKYFKFKLDDLNAETGEITGRGSWSGNKDMAEEVVVAGAFKRTLEATAGKLPMLFNHSPDEPIGVWSEMREDGRGLKVKGQINMEVARAREIHALMKQGALTGLSIGYRVMKDEYKQGVRHLTELKLFEVSVVTFPANPKAQIESVKSQEAALRKFIPAFGASNDYAQIQSSRYTMLDTLSGILGASLYETEMSAEEVHASLDSSLAQFHAAALAWADNARATMDASRAEGKSYAPDSSLVDSNQQVLRSMGNLKALLEAKGEKSDPATSHSDDSTESTGPAADAPDDTIAVSDLSLLISTIRAATPVLTTSI